MRRGVVLVAVALLATIPVAAEESVLPPVAEFVAGSLASALTIRGIAETFAVHDKYPDTDWQSYMLVGMLPAPLASVGAVVAVGSAFGVRVTIVPVLLSFIGGYFGEFVGLMQSLADFYGDSGLLPEAAQWLYVPIDTSLGAVIGLAIGVWLARYPERP